MKASWIPYGKIGGGSYMQTLYNYALFTSVCSVMQTPRVRSEQTSWCCVTVALEQRIYVYDACCLL